METIEAQATAPRFWPITVRTRLRPTILCSILLLELPPKRSGTGCLDGMGAGMKRHYERFANRICATLIIVSLSTPFILDCHLGQAKWPLWLFWAFGLGVVVADLTSE
jgi:hypothetical protein